MRLYGRKSFLLACFLILSLIGASSFVSACFSQTTECEGQSVTQGDGGATDYWYNDLYPQPPHNVRPNEGTEWIINVHGGGGCSDYEHLTVTDEEAPTGWITSITMGEIYNGDFHYYPSHIPVNKGDDIENREIYIGRTWDFDIIYNVTNDGSPLDCLDQICTVYVVGYDPENQHDYVFVHTNTHVIDSPPMVTVLSPNGNESWGGTHDITWDAVDDQIWGLNPIDIYYSTSGTSDWIEINGGSYSHDDDGEESWTLPLGIESIDCYVKVVATDAQGQSSHDISDGAFEIDTVIPTVESTDPEDDEGGVPISKEIKVTFSEPMDTSSVTITQTGGSDPGGWSWTWSPCKKQVKYTHNNWDYGEEVEMTISAGFADDTNPPNANPSAYVWNFTVTQLLLDMVRIEDQQGGIGDPIIDQTIPVGFTIVGWAAGYNSTAWKYIGDVDVNWDVTNSNGAGASTSPSSGVSSTFDAGDTPGNAIWKICDGEGHQYEVNFEIVEPGIDYVIVMDSPNGEGNPIEDQEIDVGTELWGYAAGYNDTYGYVEDIETQWSVQNFGGATSSTSPSPGLTSKFYSSTKPGTAIWMADDGNGHYGTVTFTISEMVDYIRIESYDGEEISEITLTADETLECYARAYNYATGLIGDIAVDWSILGNIGTLSTEHSNKITLDATTVGKGGIYADDGNLHTDETDDITVTHGECFSVSISPEKTTIISDMNEQFKATCSDMDGNTWEGIDGTWSESDPKGTISNSGLYEAGKVGIWTIRYTENGVYGTAKATVKMGSVKSLKITPETWSGTADDTVTFTAIGADDNGNEQDVTEYTTFTTSDPSGYFYLNIYYPAEKGDWEVTGEFHSLTDIASVSVDAGVLYEMVIEDEDGNEIDVSDMVLGQSFQAYAIGYDEDGNPIGDVYASWESDDRSVCAVGSREGYSTEITIIGSGSCKISAESSEISCSITLSIPIDSDSDGLSDTWEMDSFGHLDYDGNDDPDDDGITNLEEYLHGTDPMSAEPAESDDLAIYILLFIIALIVLFTILLIMVRRKK